MNLDRLIEQTAEPNITANRFQTLLENDQASRIINTFSDEQKTGLIKIIGISRFLYHYLHKNPEFLSVIGTPYRVTDKPETIDITKLRKYKYRSLLQISWMDVCNICPYDIVLSHLSRLADFILKTSNRLVTKQDNAFNPEQDIAIMAMGKLGANELNFSSDVDLMFVLRDDDKNKHGLHEYYTRHVRRFCRLLSENSEDGFLYRVDLNLRPWGKSAPLIYSLDDYEEYYQASKEAWERIAWLRGRYVAGSKTTGDEIIKRLRPFVFHKTLSAEDIERFLIIKRDMSEQRKKSGHWNIKLGEGGIRDIEFFVHMLQIVNGAHRPELRITNTLELLKQFVALGLISTAEQKELKDSYLFLRRLENRLQMIDEQQIHQLPHDTEKLKQIACMMGYWGASPDAAYAGFNDDLILYQQIARKYFDTLLAGDTTYS